MKILKKLSYLLLSFTFLCTGCLRGVGDDILGGNDKNDDSNLYEPIPTTVYDLYKGNVELDNKHLYRVDCYLVDADLSGSNSKGRIVVADTEDMYCTLDFAETTFVYNCIEVVNDHLEFYNYNNTVQFLKDNNLYNNFTYLSIICFYDNGSFKGQIDSYYMDYIFRGQIFHNDYEWSMSYPSPYEFFRIAGHVTDVNEYSGFSIENNLGVRYEVVQVSDTMNCFYLDDWGNIAYNSKYDASNAALGITEGHFVELFCIRDTDTEYKIRGCLTYHEAPFIIEPEPLYIGVCDVKYIEAANPSNNEQFLIKSIIEAVSKDDNGDYLFTLSDPIGTDTIVFPGDRSYFHIWNNETGEYKLSYSMGDPLLGIEACIGHLISIRFVNYPNKGLFPEFLGVQLPAYYSEPSIINASVSAFINNGIYYTNRLVAVNQICVSYVHENTLAFTYADSTITLHNCSSEYVFSWEGYANRYTNSPLPYNPEDELLSRIKPGDYVDIIGLCNYQGETMVLITNLYPFDDLKEEPAVETKNIREVKNLYKSDTTKAYIVEADVVAWDGNANTSFTYGNLILKDETNEYLFVYSCGTISWNAFEGSYTYTKKSGFTNSDLGKEVTTNSHVKVKVTYYETGTRGETYVYAELISVSDPSSPIQEPKPISTTVTDLVNNCITSFSQTYTVVGTIVGWYNDVASNRGSLILSDGENTIICYSLSATNNLLWHDDKGAYTYSYANDFLTNPKTSSLSIGSSIVVTGYIYYYKGALELNGYIVF